MSSSNSGTADAVKSVRLNAFEDGAIQNGSNPISTITWCQGNGEESATILTNRLKMILEVNPWLGGSIVTREKKNYLEYSANDESIKSMFRHLTAEEAFLSPETPFGELGQKCAEANLMPRFAFDAAKPVFQVSIMPSNDKNDNDDKFAIILTMSHVIGDGDTYYAIYHMLMSGQNIVALDPERVDLGLQHQHDQMGKWECGLLHSGGFIMAAIRGLLSTKILGIFSDQYRPKVQTILLDMDKIKTIKTKYKEEASKPETKEDPSFVSTNDIVTSWYLSNSACHHGMMAVNLRGRLDNYEKTKAGNYENLIYYLIPEDCQSPGLIRRSLASLKRVVTPTQKASNGALAKGDFAIASTWASFPGPPMQLGTSCQHLAHLPIFDAQAAGSSISMCITFRYTPEQLGVMVMGTPIQLKGLADAPFASSETIYHF